MKIFCAAATSLVLLAGCQSASNTSTSTSPTRTKSFKYSTDDGSTMSSAVEIRTYSPTEGGVLMKDWIRANHPGWTIDEQEILADTKQQANQRVYNMITIVDAANNSKRVYFDVTQFYSRREESLPGVPRAGNTPW